MKKYLLNPDNILHAILGGVLAGAVYALVNYLPPEWAYPIIGFLFVWLRELTQYQAEYTRSLFYRGWGMSPIHWAECVFPGFILLGLSLLWL